MRAVVCVLAWIGVVLTAWLLLSIAALAFMHGHGWLAPGRSERIREYEDALEHADGRESGEGAPKEQREEER